MPTDKPQLDHDFDGEAGGSLPKARRKPAAAAETVKARVTKKGADKISTGNHISGEGDETYPANTIIEMEPEAAAILEDRGWVEVQ